MSETLNIEQSIIDDLTALLIAAGLDAAQVAAEGAEVNGQATFVTIGPELRGDAFGGAHGAPSGYYMVDLELACHSYQSDDTDGDTLRELSETVRGVILDDEFCTSLTTQSSDVTYHGWETGANIRDDNGRWLIARQSLTLWLNPNQ